MLAPPLREHPIILAMPWILHVPRLAEVDHLLVVLAVAGMVADRFHAISLAIPHHDVRVAPTRARRAHPLERVTASTHTVLRAQDCVEWLAETNFAEGITLLA